MYIINISYLKKIYIKMFIGGAARRRRRACVYVVRVRYTVASPHAHTHTQARHAGRRRMRINNKPHSRIIVLTVNYRLLPNMD